MGKVKQVLLKIPLIAGLNNFAKTITLPGFQGISLHNIVAFFFKEIARDTISIRASSISFSFLLAIFPTVIFLFTLIPYIPIEDLELKMLTFLENVLPDNAYELLHSTIQDIIMIPRGGLLSLGFVLGLYFAITGMSAVMDSFDKTYRSFRKRAFFVQRLVALEVILLLSLLLIVSVILIIAGNFTLKSMMGIIDTNEEWTQICINGLRWFVVLFMFYMGFSVIYYFGPATKKSWRFFSPGSTLATVLSILTSVGFSLYVNNFGQYNKLYGSIGTFIVIMIWIYLNSTVLLLGFELNTSIEVNKDQMVEGKEKRD